MVIDAVFLVDVLLVDFLLTVRTAVELDRARIHDDGQWRAFVGAGSRFSESLDERIHVNNYSTVGSTPASVILQST